MIKWFLLMTLASASNIQTLETSNQFEDFLALRDMDAVLVTNSNDYNLINALSVAYSSLRFGHLKKAASNLFPPSTIRTYNTFNLRLEEHEFHWKSLMHLDYWIMNTTTPEIVEPSQPIFQVVYDYTKHHFLSFGLEIEMIQRLSNVYRPKIIFVDVPIDNMLLSEKFNVSSIPTAVLATVESSEMKFEHLDLDEKYIYDRLYDILYSTHGEL